MNARNPTAPSAKLGRRRFCAAGWRAVLFLAVFTVAPGAFAQSQARMPSFELETPNGTRFSSKLLGGKVALVDFWATWCQPCIEEIPRWNELYARHRNKGLVVLGITMQSGWASDIKPEVGKLKIAYPIVVGDQKVEKGFGEIWGLPTTFLVDRQGRIVKKYVGGDPQKRAQIEAELKKLLTEKP